MLTIETTRTARSCDLVSRRSFLRVGTLGLAGLNVADLMALDPAAGGEDYVRDKSVIFLYLAGGPSQIETFDPKMDAPADVRSMSGEVKTCLPGVTFGGDFPKLAAMADKLAVVRSFAHGNSNHDGGKRLFGIGAQEAALSPAYARLLRPLNSRTGMLSTAFISPFSAGFDRDELHRHMGFFYAGLRATGQLPSTFAPFHPTAGGQVDAGGKTKNSGKSESDLLADMQLNLPLDRLENRRQLLRQLDGLQRDLDRDELWGGAGEYRRQAFEMLGRGISQAFDLVREDPRTLARYDTGHFKTPPALIRQQKNGKMSAQSQTVLGRQLLLARRLCEAGCKFVTVGMNDWDMHANFNSYPIPDGMQLMGGALDHAVSALLEDLHQRGLSEKVLLVMTGEMGRTPRIKADRDTGRPGRDHWANLGALAMAGGGLKMGQVIGESDRHGGEPATEPIRPANLIATITHTLFDMGKLRLAPAAQSDVGRALSDTEPIAELI